MENTNERIVITFDEECDEQVSWDRFRIEYPMYFRCYKDALKAVLNNIENNDVGKSKVYAGGYGDDEAKGVPLYESNIIAFIGQRGSGKTTAINEFSGLLKAYFGSQEKWEQEIGSKKCNIFHVLPPIDASVLSEKEDLVQVILASMYQAVIGKQGGCSGRGSKKEELVKKIITDFDSAYKDYVNVASYGSKSSPADSVLAKLRNVSNSFKTKAAFEGLAESVLGIMENPKDGQSVNGCNSYLVVIVDDLDMNPKKAFEMLEQLYKYFSNRRMVLLIAIDYEQMYHLSLKHFVNILIPKYGSTHEKVYDKYETKAGKLANDYLLKVLPVANRIYLPERGRLHLDAKVQQGRLPECKREMKEFLLRKIAEKTNIYYDAKGLKKHFCLPDTVRELVSYNAFLDSLFSMEEIERPENVSSGRQMALYDQNHLHFNRDIEERMAIKLLDDVQLKLYKLIMERNVARRAGYMKCFVNYWIDNREKIEKEGKIHLIDSVDEQDFSYTDLIEVLYRLGRNDYEDKVLVHCILASFTSEMVREYYSYQHNRSDEARKRAAERVKNFLGTTFGGVWMAKAMPEVKVSTGSSWYSVSACYSAKVYAINFQIEIVEKELEWEDTGKWLTKALIKNLPYIECVSLMFVNARDEMDRLVTPEWEFEIDKREETEEGTQAVLRVNGHVYQASFDMFGFLGREVVLEKGALSHSKKIISALETCVLNYCERHGESSSAGTIVRKLKKDAEKNSILAAESKDIAFPYYNFDMAYNVIKRVRKKMAERTQVPSNQICAYFRTVYGYMAKCLWKEDDYYGRLFPSELKDKELEKKRSSDKEQAGEITNPRAPHLYNNFMNSPFIKIFGARDEDGKIINENDTILEEKKLNNYLLETLKSLSLNVLLNQEKVLDPE